MPRAPVDTSQITFRIPTPWLEEADEIADLISTPGKRASRTDAFREAIARGIAVIRAEKTTGVIPAAASVKKKIQTIPKAPTKRSR